MVITSSHREHNSHKFVILDLSEIKIFNSLSASDRNMHNFKRVVLSVDRSYFSTDCSKAVLSGNFYT